MKKILKTVISSSVVIILCFNQCFGGPGYDACNLTCETLNKTCKTYETNKCKRYFKAEDEKWCNEKDKKGNKIHAKDPVCVNIREGNNTKIEQHAWQPRNPLDPLVRCDSALIKDRDECVKDAKKYVRDCTKCNQNACKGAIANCKNTCQKIEQAETAALKEVQNIGVNLGSTLERCSAKEIIEEKPEK